MLVHKATAALSIADIGSLVADSVAAAAREAHGVVENARSNNLVVATTLIQ